MNIMSQSSLSVDPQDDSKRKGKREGPNNFILNHGTQCNILPWSKKMMLDSSMKFGRLARCLENDEYYVPDKPTKDGLDMKDPGDLMEYTTVMKEYCREVSELKQKWDELFSFVMSRVSPQSEEMIRLHKNFKKANEEKSPLALWRIVQATHENAKNGSHAVSIQDKILEPVRDAIVKQPKQPLSWDIVWLVDCTHGMQRFLDNIKFLMERLSQRYPDISFRLAFVGYRDHCDGDGRLAVLRFTENLEQFHDFVSEQECRGGGDQPEDVIGGLNVVANGRGIEWLSHRRRLLIHIGDAPCHGVEFHECHDDYYPAGDPYDLHPAQILKTLKEKRVEYVFAAICPHVTRKMISRFNEMIGSTYIRTVECSTHDDMMTNLFAVL